MDELMLSKAHTAEHTHERYESAFKEQPFNALRNLIVVETRPDNVLKLLQSGTVSTNMFMRRLHSFALCMGWHVGAAQVDLAALTTDNVDWSNRTISYYRKKTGALALQRFGKAVEAILKERPSEGPLFPHYSKICSADRATRFSDRCKKLGITGVSLHSFRYAWAERAREVGYPERFAQEALGHTSVAVHRSYAKGAKVTIPSLDEYEQRATENIVPLLAAVNRV